MKSIFYQFNLYLFVFLVSLSANSAVGATTNDSDTLSHLKQIETQLDSESISSDQIQVINTKLFNIQIQLLHDLDKIEKNINKLKSDLINLDASGTKDSQENKQLTAKLTQDITAEESNKAQLVTILSKANEVISRLESSQQNSMIAKLLVKGQNIFVLLQQNWHEYDSWNESLNLLIQSFTGFNLYTPLQIVILIIGTIALYLVGLQLRRRIDTRLTNIQWKKEHYSSKFSYAVYRSSSVILPALLISLFWSVGTLIFHGSIKPTPNIFVLLYGIPFFILTFGMIRLFLNVDNKNLLLINANIKAIRKLYRHSVSLLTIIFFGYLLFYSLDTKEISASLYELLRSIYAIALLVNSFTIMLVIGKLITKRSLLILRNLFVVALIFSFFSELSGYRVLSFNVLLAATETSILIGSFYLLRKLLFDFYDALDERRYGWSNRLTSLVGLEPQQHIPGLSWVRFISIVLLWTLLIFALINILGLSDTLGKKIFHYIISGIPIGSITIVPLKLLVSILIFAVLFALSGWIKKQADQKWLAKSSIERGTHESIVTFTGYVGVAVAAVIALSVAGVDFSNLALIVGALSVGIGFGLQNIVNNFVSGLILLFERPIKTGDWIIVGNTQGFVRRIRIRSTHIETFDKSDIIVPNSDLISNQVTNWMLYNTSGRIKVPVGVAYGSDTELVRDILMKVADNHNDVIKDDPERKIKVFFLGFGDSSLNFELRCFINRIDTYVQVISDINFAIDKAFRQNGIEIPFPQRDIHIKNSMKSNKED